MSDNEMSRTFLYSKEQPDDIPEDFPNAEMIFVLTDVFHETGGPFQRLLECGGIRYVLLLEFNKDVDNCAENDLLRKMYEGFDLAEHDISHCRRSLTSFSKECMKLFWPYLKEDFQARSRDGTLMDPIGPLDYERKESHKLQLKTINGSVCAIGHNTELDDRHNPYRKPYSDLRSFSKGQVEILETISKAELKVRIQGEEYMLKPERSGMSRTVDKLHSAPCHPNILSFSGVVVDAEDKIIGIATPFISGVSLMEIPSARTSQKEKWKTKISEAIRFLHNENIVWGNVYPGNVTICSATDEPMLVNFDGGLIDGWVDEDLCDTLEGDRQALPKLLKFVDDIPSIQV